MMGLRAQFLWQPDGLRMVAAGFLGPPPIDHGENFLWRKAGKIWDVDDNNWAYPHDLGWKPSYTLW